MTRRSGAAVALFLVCAAGCRTPERSIVLATTTSVAGSGLLDHLLPRFQTDHGIAVRVHSVGSGRALKMLIAGEADVAISHAPGLEADALRQHPGTTYRKLLYNDFLIAGPEADAAAVRSAQNAAEALRLIAAADARWVSRGDGSGTHERENELWKMAATRPPPELVITTGQGMSSTLRVASEMDAYTLVDRATFEQLAPRVRSRALHSGDPALLNTYAVLGRSADGDAGRFVEWLTRGAGRTQLEAVIATGTVPGFSLWPAGRPDERPHDLPR